MTDKAECPQCKGIQGGYVRTGPDEWDWETCDWCFGAGYIPAVLAAALRARDDELAIARAVFRDLDPYGLRRLLETKQGAGVWRDEQLAALDAFTEARNAWLASVSPPASREEP